MNEIEKVATLSANNDEQIGKLIADAIKAVGRDGAVVVEDSKNAETYLDIEEGLQIQRGYISPHFATNTEKMITEFDNPFILLYDKTITNLKSILSILEQVVRENAPLVIIAEDVSGEALAALLLNKMRGAINVVAIRAPGFGDNRKATLEDISIATGGVVVSEEFGYKLESVTLDMLGRARKVVVEKDKTTIIGGYGDPERIKERIDHLRIALKEATSDYDKKNIQERLAKLSGGVAVLYVGGMTEVEMTERKDRVDDALHATNAAIEEGIVPGGGVAYLRAAKAMLRDPWYKSLTGDVRIGVEIVRKALEEPLKQIAYNAGQDGKTIVEKVSKMTGNKGWDAKENKFCDLVEAGVIDPVKVVRTALENAASIASILVTTECLIVKKPEENDKKQ